MFCGFEWDEKSQVVLKNIPIVWEIKIRRKEKRRKDV